MASANAGTCELCGRRASKPQMGQHITTCAANHDASGRRESILQLRVDAAEDPQYWLYIEARADASLQQLDALLRRVWLECCGHMSAFRVGQSEPPMRSKIGVTLNRKGLKVTYDYDFGSTTALSGQVLGSREGSLGRAATRLIARNDPPQWHCDTCTELATIVCPFCIGSSPYLFCNAHAQKHPCAAEGVYLPVVNSPRMGICAYAGCGVPPNKRLELAGAAK